MNFDKTASKGRDIHYTKMRTEMVRKLTPEKLIGRHHLKDNKYCSGNQIENNEMGRACSKYGGEVCTGF
jgi:hypothetical protein